MLSAQDRRRLAVHRRARGRPERQRVGQGPRDDVPADLHDGSPSRAPTRTSSRSMQTQIEDDARQHAATPDFAFSEALNEALTQNHPRERTPTPEMFDQHGPGQVAGVLQGPVRRCERLHVRVRRHASTRPRCKPLVEKYLASLPSTGRKETWKDHNVRPPSAVVERRVREGARTQEPLARRLHRARSTYNQEQRIAHPRRRVGAPDAPARNAARGPRRHLQRVRVGGLHQDSAAGVHASRLTSAAARTAPTS